MRLAEFVEINPRVNLPRGEDHPCVMMEDVTPGRRYVSSSARRAFKSGAVFQTGDTLFARITPCLENGKIAQFADEENEVAFGSTEFIVFRHRKGISDPAYVFYLALSDTVRKPAEKSMFGASGRQRADLNVIKEIEVSTPPLLIQRRIASILSAYDDLIENNTRRIKILEEMARLIYREWFVEFRAPGVKLRKATPEEQKVTGNDVFPVAWELKPVGQLLAYHIGGGWGEDSQSEDYPVKAYVIRGTDIPSVRCVAVEGCPLRFHKQSNFDPRRLEVGDIVFEVSGGGKEVPVGRSLLVSQHMLNAFDADVICASFCKLLRVSREEIASELFYLHLLDFFDSRRVVKFQVQSTGIKNLKFAHFLDDEFVTTPDRDSQAAFIEKVQPMFGLIQNLGLRNGNLRRTRDLLLPKLVSGEIDVSSHK